MKSNTQVANASREVFIGSMELLDFDDNSDKQQQLELVMPRVAYKGKKRWSVVVGVVVAAMVLVVSATVCTSLCHVYQRYNLKKCLNQAQPIKSLSRRSKQSLTSNTSSFSSQ